MHTIKIGIYQRISVCDIVINKDSVAIRLLIQMSAIPYISYYTLIGNVIFVLLSMSWSWHYLERKCVCVCLCICARVKSNPFTKPKLPQSCNLYVPLVSPMDLRKFHNPDYVQGNHRGCSLALTHAHYNDVIMGAKAYQITSLTIVYMYLI